MYVCMYVCIYLSIYLTICLSICPSIHPSIHPFVFLSIRPLHKRTRQVFTVFVICQERNYHLPKLMGAVSFVHSLNPFLLAALRRTSMRVSFLSISKPWNEHVLFGRKLLQLRQLPPCFLIWTWKSDTEPPPESREDGPQLTSTSPHSFGSTFVIDGLKGTPINVFKKR